MLAKSMQKHAGRAKEKILQNLGKVDRTADEIFDDHLNNFNRQQASANRLQKEFNNYIRCIRAVQVASKSLMDAIGEIYEPQWSGYDALQAQSAASESLWQDFAHKLGDQVLIPLNTYTGQFPEMKKKIEKRNRKLIDYDGQRHSFQSLQANANKRKDDVKLTKGREQLEDARRTYEILNTELHDELPALYDSRILFLVTNLQTLFATENVFHNETAKIYSELEAIVDKLATESQRGSNTLRKQTQNAINASPLPTPVKQLNNTSNVNNSNYQNQITTNGSSNVNSPSTMSSSSQHESRLDSVSPTPESTPENLQGKTTATNTSSTSSSIPNSPVRSKATTPIPTTTTLTTGATNLVENIEEEQKHENVNSKEVTATTTTDNDHKIVNETTTTITTTDSTTDTTTTINNNKNVKYAELPMEQLNGNNITTKTTATVEATTTVTAVATATATPANGNIAKTEKTAVAASTTNNGNIEEDKKSIGEPIPSRTNVKSRKLESKNPFEEDELIYEVPADATTADLPPGVLYRVKATYGYVKEDVDELSFEIGDIIRVIEYDDPEDQEEGWLMGEKEGTTEKGLFPANFTRPI